MKNVLFFLIFFFLVSCGHLVRDTESSVITVSISPFKYFVEEIAGEDFTINIMVPQGSDPHVYEPLPEQIAMLGRSVGYISNGYLGFETIWLERFYEINSKMKRLSLNAGIEPLHAHDDHEGGHEEESDPHYWCSPKCAMIMAASVKDFLSELNPSHRDNYEANYLNLANKINALDISAMDKFSSLSRRTFMIFHPNLGYLARDYGLEEISLEYEGKEPSPSKLRDLIDIARNDSLNTIFVQREFDIKNARVIADEIGARVVIIDPLSDKWLQSTTEIVEAIYNSLSIESGNN